MTARLPATERRAAVLDSACCVFARCSYRGATTAEIARQAGITEPVLYRHFESKQALYLACIDEAWGRVRETWERAVEAESDPEAWLPAMTGALFELGQRRSPVATLWLQALTDGGDDPEVRRFLRRHLRDVHEFVAGVLRRCQDAGEVSRAHDARAEAWSLVAIGLLIAVTGRIGGLQPGDLERIRASRQGSLTGAA
jgi:TetR/AcrR family transcriptional regulator